MKMYQVAIAGLAPTGGYYKTREAANREIGFLRADDRRCAEEAMREAGIELEPTEYEVVEVEVTE